MNFQITFRHFFLLFIFTVLLPLKVFADEFRIIDIRVEGLQRVSAGPVFAALPFLAGDVISDKDAKKIIRSLFATGFFTDIEVAHDDGILIISVEERAAISQVNIEGNKAIKTEVLTNILEENGLAQGQILQRDTLDGIVREVERQYVAQGRYSAQVETQISPQPNNQVKVDITINEGSVASIKHINIIGNNNFTEKELKGLFESRSTGWLSWLNGNDRYSREKLKGDIENLESFYLDRGYLDFEVVSSQISLSPDKKAIFITLNLSEGDIYTVSELEVAGDPILPVSSIRRLILLRPGGTFGQNLMTATSEYITTLLGNSGYTNAEVEGIPERDVENKTVKVTFFIDPKERVYVRRIEFRGNTRTTDEVLRREMRQIEGASASNARIEQGKIRLNRLGFFKEVNVENKEVPGSSDQVDVIYTVEEQPSGQVSASVGFSNGIGAIISASLQENNWLGTGKRVGVSVNRSRFQTAYNLSYSDPYFTPDGVSRGISVFFQDTDFGEIGGVQDFSTDRYGVGTTFGYPISEIQRLNFGVELSRLEIETGSFAAEEISSSFRQIDLNDNLPDSFINLSDIRDQSLGTGLGVLEDFRFPGGFVTDPSSLQDVPLGFVDVNGNAFSLLTGNIGWVRSTLNRGVLATRGSFQSANFEISLPGSDVEYYKFEYDGQFFKPLTRDLTLRFKTNLGYGDGYGDTERFPFFENFRAGGFGSVRGFRRSSLGPRSSPAVSYLTTPAGFTAEDIDGDGVNDSVVPFGSSNVLCDVAASEIFQTANGTLGICDPGQLALELGNEFNSRRSFGGNVLAVFSTEIIFPVPFIEDQRSTQLAFFADAGNVFDTECGPFQNSCSEFSFSDLSSSYGLSLVWISGFGPLSFSISKPINLNELDRREAFQFSFGSGF